MTDALHDAPMTSSEQLRIDAEYLQPQLVAWRRDFHMHPELGYQEVRTAGIVADHLRNLGLEVSTGIGKTGVVAIVEGDNAAPDAPTVLLRFDMDALPVTEITGLSYASQSPGVMHACGHDGHTAIGMGVAQLLVKHRAGLGGRVKLVFQPAEEGLGGALAMIADGVMEDPRPAASFGMHIWSRLPLNQVVVQEGPLWAGADIVDLVITGRGGHGAMPHETVDAIVIGSEIVLAWQTIVSRNVDPVQPAVISVGAFHAGTVNNIIAEQAVLKASIRSLNFEMRDYLVQRMREVAEGICRPMAHAPNSPSVPACRPRSTAQAACGLMDAGRHGSCRRRQRGADHAHDGGGGHVRVSEPRARLLCPCRRLGHRQADQQPPSQPDLYLGRARARDRRRLDGGRGRDVPVSKPKDRSDGILYSCS